MDELERVVARLSQIVDELLAVDDGDYAARFALEKERDELRAQAETFRERKDERRSSDELRAELAARESQLAAMKDQLVNRATQASVAAGGGGGGDVPLGERYGGNTTHAALRAMGGDKIRVRISEIEQELSRRG